MDESGNDKRERVSAKVLNFPTVAAVIRRTEGKRQQAVQKAMREKVLEEQRELEKIDKVANKIIKELGLNFETVQKMEGMSKVIARDAEDIDVAKVKLLHWDGRETNPELYLGLALLWQTFRPPTNPTPTES